MRYMNEIYDGRLIGRLVFRMIMVPHAAAPEVD